MLTYIDPYIMLQPRACKSELISRIILANFNLHRSLYNAAIGSSGVVQRQHIRNVIIFAVIFKVEVGGLCFEWPFLC